MSGQELPMDAPQPRLCHLVKWEDFDGYGFNLHAEKSRSGQFIGKVDQDSPAQYAALQEGDRIIEVNGVNIANENHRQVVERIKSIPNETKLLVVDEEADRWYKEKKIVVKSTQSNVSYAKTPVPRPKDSSESEPPSYENISVPSNGSVTENGVNNKSPENKPSPKTESNGKAPNSYNDYEEPDHVVKVEEKPITNGNKIEGSPKLKEEVNSRSSTPMEGSVGSAPDSPRSLNSSRSGSVGGHSNQNGASPPNDNLDLNLNMSASEMRQKLASRKKKDPKKVQMDIRQKYEIIQQM